MTSQLSETTSYAIDSAHSTAAFVVRHLMIAKVRGLFAGVSGTIDFEPNSDVPSFVQATIDATCIDTREAQRDAHLRSADFLEVERYPTIEFVSTRIRGSAETFTIDGNLTIHGMTRAVELKAALEGRGPDMQGKQRVGYSASTTINRKDFGLTWNAALETGGVVVGDGVRIELDVQGTLRS
ncbi:MAG TPA: YceI family protein [Candidatus Eremiobacteraceae bacterium]|nr:YceI family protein [Candidatus Eremiobacteraceae bacterium]